MSLTDDRTLNQTASGQSASQRLSMEATTPPSEVPGYRLLKFLGAGAFGQVWVGRDLNTGRGVAVKFYLHRGGVNWSLLSREVKNLVQLSADRHVVQVLEVGWDADPPYYVMELVNGGSLQEMLNARGRLSVDESVEIFRKICVGLNHCHNKGVLHCDVKPANILMAEDDEPKLADFGQSRMSHDQSPALGTLFYMAPEQADLDATPEASWDVYAAGAILFQMLTGRPPFRNDSVVTQIDTAGSLPKRLEHYREAIRSQPPTKTQLQRKDVDRPLRRIIAKCLAAEPADRYRNIQQILADLRRRDEVQARRPLLLLGIVGPLLLLLATSIFAARTINHASDEMTGEVRRIKFGSNRWVARTAAQQLKYELEQYFALTNVEAAREELKGQIAAALKTPEIAEQLKLIRSSSGENAGQQRSQARTAIFDHPQRLKLDAILARQLAGYVGESRTRTLASMFVTDASGTMVGIAYAEDVNREENSAGRNYSYRTYFHGGRDDLARPQDNQPIANTQPLTKTHLASAFQSTATGLWKVGIGTPIYLTPESESPDAVFVVTINLGDFQLLPKEQVDEEVAVLVDAREGGRRGTLLQHPVMQEVAQQSGETDDSSLVGMEFQIPEELMDKLTDGGDVDYRDPVVTVKGGEEYAGEWIAAIEPIELPEKSTAANDREDDFSAKVSRDGTAATMEPLATGEDSTTDLLVLVQYRQSKMFAPVSEMKSSLYWEGAAAILSVFIVTMTMWYFVLRASGSDSEDLEPDPQSPEDVDVAETMPAQT